MHDIKGETLKLVVIGGMNVDFVIQVDQFPEKGESVLGIDFHLNSGGKGANKAVAATKLGAYVFMIGKVGDDSYGSWIIENLNASGVNTDFVLRADNIETGKAFILVQPDGESRIIALPGANRDIKPADIKEVTKLIQSAKALLLQFEIPQMTVEQCIEIAHNYKVPVILNAAPAIYSLSPSAWSKVNILICNENESSELCKDPSVNLKSIQDKISHLLSKGIETVIITLGGGGVLFNQGQQICHMPAYKVKVVDTTSAGDAFVAGFSIALAKGETMRHSVMYGQVVAAITTSRLGTQISLPNMEEVNEFIRLRTKKR